MKQIFDWLREQTEAKSEHYKEKADYIWEEELSAFNQGISKGMRIAKTLVDEAEAKWETDCCEWKFEKNTGLVWHCENECESYNISYQRELKTFLEEFECKCPHCRKPIKISEVE